MTRSKNQQAAQAVCSAYGHGGAGQPTASPKQLRALVLGITLVLAIAAGTGWLALRSLATLAFGLWGWREWVKLRQQGARRAAEQRVS